MRNLGSMLGQWSAQALLAAAVALGGCGGGGSDAADPPPAASSGSFTVSGTVQGLQGGPVTLNMVIFDPADGSRRNELLPVDNGPYAFNVLVPAGADVVVGPLIAELTPTQVCRPASLPGRTSWEAENMQADADVSFRCGPAYRLGGTASGSTWNGQVQVFATIDGVPMAPNGISPQSLAVPGPFSLPGFETFTNVGLLMAGEQYAISKSPNYPECSVTDGVGIMPAHDVDTVRVHCGRRRVFYEVVGLVGSGLQLALLQGASAAQLQAIETASHDNDGRFAFEGRLNEGETYAVTITANPTGPTQSCSVERGEGVVGKADVTDIVIRCPSMLRQWSFTGIDGDPGNRSNEARDGVVHDTYQFPDATGGGTPPSVLLDLEHADLDIYKNLFDLPGTQMGVYSNETGKTFWVAAETPSVNRSPRLTQLTTYWWMRKTKNTATIRFQITDVWLDAFVDGAAGLYGADPQRRYLESLGGMSLQAFRVPAGAARPLQTAFYWAQDLAQLTARPNAAGAVDWTFRVVGEVDGPSAPLFDESMFEVRRFRNNLFGTVGSARVSLKNEIDLVIDLSGIGPDDRVMLVMQAFAMVRNEYSRESLATAYFRDPAEFDLGSPKGGITITGVDGLELVEPQALPADFQPTPDTTPAPACAAPSGPRASVQFGAGAYALGEQDMLNRVVTVTRTGSTVGEVTARLRMAPGTAAEGADFAPREFFVRFADGNATPRSVTIPLIDDNAQEGPETMTLSLVEVSGCADLGALSSATLTILDDDTPPPATGSYTLGGTVTGLAGSGLVIEAGLSELAVTANGAFQFGEPFAAGVLYSVRVKSQPQNPRQVCEVLNGEGTVTTHVTNVQVTCTTLPEPGSLDPAFGTGGRAFTTLMGAWPPDTQLALQADGKLLVVGGNSGLLRLLPDGTPDASFGPAGTALVTVTSGQRDPHKVTAVALQPDGRIVVAGYSQPSGGRTDFLVARYHADGTLDTSFAGGAGIATFDYRAWNDGAYHVLIQGDGSILLVGSVSDAGGNGDPSDFAVLKLTAAGQVDTTYGTGGWARTNVAGGYDVPRAAVLAPDGGVVLVGRVAASGGANADVGIVKFTAAGVPDAAFGPSGNGIVRPLTSEHDEARDIVVLPDGRLLVAGERRPSGAGVQLWLARYSATGQLDTGFGTSGLATPHAPFAAYALAVRADGSLWVAGDVNAGDGVRSDYGLARFTAAGQPDATFNGGAVLALDLFGGFDTPGAMLLQPDGKVVIAGAARNGSTGGLGVVRVVP